MDNHINADNQSLTEFEVIGLKTTYNFADGHAHHAMPAALLPVINDLQNIWHEAGQKPVAEVEEGFKAALAGIIKSPVLLKHQHYSLFPTASNSIDAVCAWLKNKDYTVGLIEPVFDNLYLLLKRHRVPIVPVQEQDFQNPDALEQKIKAHKLNSLFLVSPNNPTGFQLTQAEFSDVCKLCAKLGVMMVLDATFGLYSRPGYDEYQILHDTGIDYIVIEDTGKTWPTQEIKVSLMAYSAPLAKEMRVIYEEVFLSHSNFAVTLLSKLIEKTASEGIDRIIWNEVDARRDKLAQALAGSALKIDNGARGVPLPLAWVDCSATGLTDLELIEKLKGLHIALLPGRFFFWSQPDSHTDHVRVSLLRSPAFFDRGLEALNHAIFCFT